MLLRGRKENALVRKHRNDRAGQIRPSADADPALLEPAQWSDGSEAPGGDFFGRSINKKAEQKARQLCRQVYRTLSLSLGGCGDETLQDLVVIAVDAAPDAGHLLITVSAPRTGAAVQPSAMQEVLERLSRATG